MTCVYGRNTLCGAFQLLLVTVTLGCGSSSLPLPSGGSQTDGGEVGATTDGEAGVDASAGPGEGGSGLQQIKLIYGINPVRDLDLLFMVDNSASTGDQQDELSKSVPVFLDELKKIPAGAPNLHIGIISSDMGAGRNEPLPGTCPVGGDRGIFRVRPNCGLDPKSRFLVSSNNLTVNNFQGDISTVFSCLALLGENGCGFEHQLQATRVALYESITQENAGFLRQNAYLGIILLTDEDDCSASPDSDLFSLDDPRFAGTTASFRCAEEGHLCGGQKPPVGPYAHPYADCDSNENGRLVRVQDVVTSIRALKPRPDQQIMVAAIAGMPDDPATAMYRYGAPTGVAKDIDYLEICRRPSASRPWSAAGGLRIKRFVESFGANGSLHSICAESFRPAMKQIGERIALRMSATCIPAPLVDTRPEPGVQSDCQVIDEIPRAGAVDSVPLPQCGAGAIPCWKLVADDATCPASGFRIVVDRGSAAPPQGAVVRIQCTTCAVPGDPRCAR